MPSPCPFRIEMAARGENKQRDGFSLKLAIEDGVARLSVCIIYVDERMFGVDLDRDWIARRVCEVGIQIWTA